MLSFHRLTIFRLELISIHTTTLRKLVILRQCDEEEEDGAR